jgi:CheY-like chemotaxis protein
MAEARRLGMGRYAVVLRLKVGHFVLAVTFMEQQAKSLGGKRVLVVDDSSLIRNLITKALGELGVEVAVAADGLEAIERHGEFRPDVTLMDVVMPRLGGLDAIARIRERTAEGKFIVLTSTSRRDEVITAKTLGVHGYLLKPVRMPQLLEAVVAALR